MPISVRVSATPIGIQQRIAAGSKFTGALPEGTALFENSVNKHPEAATGGLFYFENPRAASVTHYLFDFGASVPYELAVVSLTKLGEKVSGERTVFAQGTGRYVTGPAQFGFILGAHQAIEVTHPGLSNPTAAMIGTVWAIDATAFLAG